VLEEAVRQFFDVPCTERLLTAMFEVLILGEELKEESGPHCKCAVFLFCDIIAVV